MDGKDNGGREEIERKNYRKKTKKTDRQTETKERPVCVIVGRLNLMVKRINR